MAKRPRVVKKRRKTNYKFYRIIVKSGTQRTKGREEAMVAAFLLRYGYPERSRCNDIQASYVNKFIDYMDRKPLDARPHNIELQDPIGRVVRRWSRVRSWNIPEYLVDLGGNPIPVPIDIEDYIDVMEVEES